jgi:pyruvate-ferredoxin/flavodoxin oxidoreductase
VQAVFFGLGSDGTVGANKASVKIIGEDTDLWSQGVLRLRLQEAGSVTVSHLRFGPRPIRSTYMVEDADFVACHQFGLLARMKVLDEAKPGATVPLNAPYASDALWDRLPVKAQQQLVDKGIDLWVIDAHKAAAEAGMGNRINTVMQPRFFKLSGGLPPEEAIAHIKAYVGSDVAMMTSAVLRNGPAHFAAVEAELRFWMARHEYIAVEQLRGSASEGHTDDPSAFERAKYMTTLHSRSAPPKLTPGPARPDRGET